MGAVGAVVGDRVAGRRRPESGDGAAGAVGGAAAKFVIPDDKADAGCAAPRSDEPKSSSSKLAALLWLMVALRQRSITEVRKS
ncbi:MAG: hypothetical protein AB7E67_00005, partial [Xanthobacteraceae bacterium]